MKVHFQFTQDIALFKILVAGIEHPLLKGLADSVLISGGMSMSVEYWRFWTVEAM